MNPDRKAELIILLFTCNLRIDLCLLEYLKATYPILICLFLIKLEIQSPTSLVLNDFPTIDISSLTIPSVIDFSTAFLIKEDSSSSLKAYSNIIPADSIVAKGLAMFFPVAFGYDPFNMF